MKKLKSSIGWVFYITIAILLLFSFPAIGTYVPPGTGSIDTIQLVDDSVTSAKIDWAEPITVPFGERVNYGDSGMHIRPSADGDLSITSDTNILSSGAWTHTGNFSPTTYGSLSITNTEIGYLDGVTSPIQTQFGLKVTGDSGYTTDQGIARFNAGGYAIEDSGVTIDDSDNMDIPGTLTLGATPQPGWTWYDSDVSSDDVGKIYADATDANDSIMYLQVEQGNALVNYVILDGVNERVLFTKDIQINTFWKMSAQVITVTTEADLSITKSNVRLNGDNDADNDTVDLQDGTADNQMLYIVANSNVDVDDTITVAMTDTTCQSCPAIVFNSVGDNATLMWVTGQGWRCYGYMDN